MISTYIFVGIEKRSNGYFVALAKEQLAYHLDTTTLKLKENGKLQK